MDIERTDLETKAGIPAAAAADAVVTHSEMMRAFEAFKEANDQQLAAIAKGGGDVVLEEKVARITKAPDSGPGSFFMARSPNSVCAPSPRSSRDRAGGA